MVTAWRARSRSVKNAAVLRICQKSPLTNKFATGDLRQIQVPAFLKGPPSGNPFPPPATPGGIDSHHGGWMDRLDWMIAKLLTKFKLLKKEFCKCLVVALYLERRI